MRLVAIELQSCISRLWALLDASEHRLQAAVLWMVLILGSMNLKVASSFGLFGVSCWTQGAAEALVHVPHHILIGSVV